MSTSELKTNINRLIENVNDERFLNSVLVILKEYGSSRTSLSKGQLAELELRVKRHDKKNDLHPWKSSLEAIRTELGK
ncbi:MAG: hypothetical protein JKX84_04870 [Flavobacteriales bacterium]|nr:hypothetical protein [Flavobacteriales bacterium]